MEFHPNSNYVVTGSTDRTCRLWDVSNGDCVRVFQGHSEAVHCVAFSSDGNYLASGGMGAVKASRGSVSQATTMTSSSGTLRPAGA